jgi:hypothetical protein
MKRPELQSWRVAGLQAAALLLLVAAPIRAQQPQHDPRREAWFGCWMAAEGAAQSPTGRAPTVCVIPAGGGVDVATVVDTTVVARDHLEANPERHPVSLSGCTGWETARWSSEGDRLYRHSEYTCPGDVKRSTSEVFAITPEWEWLDVQGLASHGGMGVRTLRYRSAAVPAVVEIATALAAHTPEISMARAAAATPPTTADVIEASREAEAAVVEAWLAEEGEGFPLTGKQLLALSDSGVPGRVIDVMVAMTYPKVFTVAAPSARGGFNGAEASPRAPVPDTMYASRPPNYGYGLYGPPSPWGWDYYSPWSWSLYGYYSPFFYSPYGAFSPYGYGGYGGYYYGGGTVIVLSGGGNSNPQQPHGQYVKGHGYQHGNGDTSGSHPAATRASGASSSSGGSSAPASSSGRSSGSSSSSQAGQHAHPKP